MRHQSYRFNIRADRGDKNDLVYRPPQGLILPEYACNKQWRAPIRDQGTEGACSAFTARGAMAYMRGRKGHPYVEFSPQYFYHNELIVENKTAKYDTGVSIRTIPKTLEKYGICEETLWPYDKKTFSDPTTQAVVDNALKYRAYKYLRVTSLYDLRYAIAVDKFCVMIGVSVYDSILSDEVAKTGMIPLPTKGDKLSGGHALLVDTYDFRNALFHGPIFSGPNSWGADWGDRGAFHMPVEFIQDSDCLNDIWIVTK